MHRGFTRDYRKVEDWEWYKTPHMYHLFRHLIREANYKDGKWQGIEVKRGQLITGRKALSFDTGIPEQSIRTCLDRLKSTNEITIKVTSKFSIITICNYDTYQFKEDEVNQQNNHELTNNQPASNQQVTTNNNYNNINNINNNINNTDASASKLTLASEKFYLTKKKRKLTGKKLDDFEQFWKAYNFPKGKAEAADSWLELSYDESIYEKIITSAKKEAYARPDLIAKGRTPKYAQGWLSGRRWEDMDEVSIQSKPIKPLRVARPEGIDDETWERVEQEIHG